MEETVSMRLGDTVFWADGAYVIYQVGQKVHLDLWSYGQIQMKFLTNPILDNISFLQNSWERYCCSHDEDLEPEFSARLTTLSHSHGS